MFISLAIHHPRPDKEQLLLNEMRRLGAVLELQPGIQQVHALKDQRTGDIVALSIWRSKADFLAAGPTVQETIKNVPFDEWEATPRQIYLLDPA